MKRKGFLFLEKSGKKVGKKGIILTEKRE